MDKESRVNAAAKKWGYHPEEIRALEKMLSSGPWKIVQEKIDEIADGASSALLNGDDDIKIFRAQGAMGAIKDLKSRLSAIVKEVNDNVD